MKCKQIWQPNFDDSKSIKKGYLWKCYCCGRVRKTTPDDMKKVNINAHLRGLIRI